VAKGAAMTKPTQIEVVKSIVNSIFDVNSKHYMNVSDEHRSIPHESDLRDCIVSDLRKNISSVVDYEYSIDKVMEESNTTGERPKSIKSKGLIDILIRREDLCPEVIIELKTQRGFSTYKRDVSRLRDMLLVNPCESSLKYGIMALSVWQNRPSSKRGLIPGKFVRGNVQGIIRDGRNEAEKTIGGKRCIASLIYPEEIKVVDKTDIAWSAVCIILEPLFAPL
jgi:hypothetical protein